MSRSKRSSPQGADRGQEWLGSEEPTRSRRWAYEELLLGPEDDADRKRELSALSAELAIDLAELRRMENELFDQVVRVAGLEGRLQALLGSSDGVRGDEAERRETPVEIRSFPSDPIHPPAAVERGGSLARCEGFRVDSPNGFVGFVDGLRFMSRIDEPDLLEVRGGRFGRGLALIPIEAVEEISLAEERVVVRMPPSFHEEPAHGFVSRLRRALDVVTASLR
jgi:hypothetical protein